MFDMLDNSVHNEGRASPAAVTLESFMKSAPLPVLSGLCLLSAAMVALLGGCASLSEHQGLHSRYHPGQRWAYKTRPGEENSTLVIGNVEPQPADKTGAIVHICLEGLKLAGPEGKTIDHIGHMPMSQQAIDKSVTVLLGQNAPPTSDYNAGYDYWKSAGGGGTFGITVEQAVSYYEKVIQPRHKKTEAITLSR